MDDADPAVLKKIQEFCEASESPTILGFLSRNLQPTWIFPGPTQAKRPGRRKRPPEQICAGAKAGPGLHPFIKIFGSGLIISEGIALRIGYLACRMRASCAGPLISIMEIAHSAEA